MTVTEAPDGWFIERDGRYYHVNQAWLDEMHRHQVKPYTENDPAFNRLQHAFVTGVSADAFGELFVDFIDHRTRAPQPTAEEPVEATPEQEFRKFIAEKRNNNAKG